MYTQCPECDVAFRVTAEVLKMAAGQVRCGGCGAAFNALEHLSETKPVARRQPDPEPQQPAPDEPVVLTPDTPPDSISAEQSAALLKTLDDLSGEDIRIEDTGVEWRVIGNEPEEPTPEPQAQSPNEPSRIIEEMLFDDNTVLPDDFDAVVDAISQPQPVETPPPAEPEPPQVDLDLSEPDEWDDLLDDLAEPDHHDGGFEATEPAADLDQVESEFEEPTAAISFDASDDHLAADDVDFDVETPAAREDETEADDDLETSIEEDLFAAAFESEAAAKSDKDGEPDSEGSDEDDDEFPDAFEIDLQSDEDFESEDVENIAMPFDDAIEATITTLSMSLNEELDSESRDPKDDSTGNDVHVDTSAEHDESAQQPDSDDSGKPEPPVIPEMSEEEKTINMMIDEELLSIAVEDEDGFASTIVQLQPDEKVGKEISDKESANQKDNGKNTEVSSGDADEDGRGTTGAPIPAHATTFETIIMEGETIRAELGRQALNEEEDASDDPDVELSLNREKDDYELRREMTSHRPGAGTYAALGLLVLLLVVQVVHQSRAALATVPAFNAAVGPIYRMLGMPLTPAWNIAGWRFEATKGDTDESGEVLTIYSRIGNNAESSLPYPLVHVSLTDRFEDIIGSTVLEPAEYLPENADPSQLVPPGDTFNAVITINSPSPEATGFKLNVCYRLAGGQLRCADHDFK
jgi:predicted Zn finger-like uncharacterized protein